MRSSLAAAASPSWAANALLRGLPIELVAVLIVAARHGARTARRPRSRRVIAARAAILAFGLGLRLRHGWTAILVGVSLIALPYTVATLPLLPDPVSMWLLRLTLAAELAVQQTMTEYPQVTAHYAPSAGYFPLPWWAGLALLGAYTVIVMWIAVGRKPVADTDGR
ncbi:hypothetical protein ACFPOI_44480 [Nonomuraea angiospora]